MKVIGVVDDDESVRAAIGALLRSVGYHAVTFSSAELFLKAGGARDFECLILDLRMPGIDGLELQRKLNSGNSSPPIIFISAHDDVPNRRKAMGAGAADFFRKPFDGGALLCAIEAAIHRRDNDVDQNDLPGSKRHSILARTAAMSRVPHRS